MKSVISSFVMTSLESREEGRLHQFVWGDMGTLFQEGLQRFFLIFIKFFILKQQMFIGSKHLPYINY